MITEKTARTNVKRFDKVGSTPEQVQAYLERHSVEVTGSRRIKDATMLLLEKCPITDAEGGSSVGVKVADNGRISYCNLHNRGAGIRWRDLRDFLEPGYKAHAEKSFPKRGDRTDNLKENRDLVVVTFDQLMAMDIRPRAHLLAPWLRRQDLVMVHSYRGVGKTWFGLGLAVAVATGGEFLKWKARKPRRVLIVDGEMQADDLKGRGDILLHYVLPTPGEKLRLITPDLQNDPIPCLSDRTGQELVERYLDKVDLLVLDNISSLFREGPENEAEGWQPAQDWLLKLRRQGIAVILMHHQGKKLIQRGTSKREDVLNTVIGLRRPNDYQAEQGARFEVRFEKYRGSPDESSEFEAQFLTAGPLSRWDIRPLAESQKDLIVGMAREGYRQKDIAKELGCDKSWVSRVVKSAREEGKL